MADTFAQIWQSVLAFAPETPPHMAKLFVNVAYRKATEYMRWANTRGVSEFQIPDTYNTGTVTVARNSATVTGAGVTWTTAMIGRQIYLNGEGPFYTISARPDATTLTLDRVYGGESASLQPYNISLVFVSVPSDCLFLTDVVDVENGFKLRTGVTQGQLDLLDPQRTTVGDSVLLAAATPSSTGLPRYELWPRKEEAWTYPFSYIRRIPDLSATTDTPIFPLRGDVLREGALAELSKWPGTEEYKNPYFSSDSHRMHSEEFRRQLDRLDVADQEANQTDIAYAGGEWDHFPYAPLDANYLQKHVIF